ncbi:MAG: hypothetical protein QOK05_631 [Chloroflexota bacterium]|jgi:DNA-binding GntR family transcriptional regulator|nr:hypothetical protein [Chloroflexota bacterium]
MDFRPALAGNRGGDLVPEASSTPRRIPLIAAPLRKQVIELLRDDILASEFVPGQRLVERALCERFDVSRTVIREALRHLEAEGMVEMVAHRGPIVSRTSPEEAANFYEVRGALESLAAKCFAERATPAHRRQLARVLAQVKSAYKKGSLDEQLTAKDEFYRVLCEGTGNPVIQSSLRTIQARVHMLRGLSLKSPGRTDASYSELERVFAAIETGDGTEAGRLALLHVQNAAAAAMKSLAEGASAGQLQEAL